MLGMKSVVQGFPRSSRSILNALNEREINDSVGMMAHIERRMRWRRGRKRRKRAMPKSRGVEEGKRRGRRRTPTALALAITCRMWRDDREHFVNL